ncbi:MAG TPA: CDP-alcohol phosphatidyltransferase family protein [Rhizomicrobium sp.]|nr:CDP-alcohol phosphatidyltransferase family protein [Rhizomicrobium sp.]
MLDGTNKAISDRLWDALAAPLARAGLTPNQITWAGLVLVLLNCALFYVYRSTFWFGIGLAIAFTFDGLDGAVARMRGLSSKYGGYLDAVVDRYQEIAVYLTLALVTGWWFLAFLAITGSLMTSYNKARTAVEISIDNNAWPDLLERLERVFILCAALIFDSFIALPANWNVSLLSLAMLAIGVLSHLTALQRFIRAAKLIQQKTDG